MTVGQLSWIKQRQREHQELFGAPLLIDFSRMKDVSTHKIVDIEKIKDWLRQYVAANNVDMDIVKNKKLSNNYPVEYRFIKNFAKFLKDNNLNYNKAAKLIGKERTTLRHHMYKL